VIEELHAKIGIDHGLSGLVIGPVTWCAAEAQEQGALSEKRMIEPERSLIRIGDNLEDVAYVRARYAP